MDRRRHRNSRKGFFQSEGAWDYFVELRESLKADGYEAREAIHIAEDETWEKIAQGYFRTNGSPTVGLRSEPLADDDHVQTADREDRQLPAELFERQSRDFLAIVWFVFDNLDNPHADPMDAPSAGAWSYLQHCRESEIARSDFYQHFWKLAPSRAQVEKSGAAEAGKDANMQLLDDLLAKIGRNAGKQNAEV